MLKVQSTTFGVSEEGNYIVSSSSDGIVRMWDMASGVGKQVLESGQTSVCMKFWNSGNYIMGSRDDHVWVWDKVTGKCTCTLQSASRVTTNERFIVAEVDGSIQQWDSESAQWRKVIVEQGASLSHLSKGTIITRQGKGSTPFIVTMWDINTAEIHITG
jgi:WD40 repeat protein